MLEIINMDLIDSDNDLDEFLSNVDTKFNQPESVTDRSNSNSELRSDESTEVYRNILLATSAALMESIEFFVVNPILSDLAIFYI